MEDILAIVLIFGGGSVFLFAISPIGRAIADRIRSGTTGAASASAQRLEETQQGILEELDAVRQELGEVQERLDFTERLLAQQREVPRLPGGDAPGAVQ